MEDTSMKPYVIWAPDFRNVSAGIRVLYLLGHLLRERGYRAEMMMTHGPFVGNPWGVPECVAVPNDAIHVYPEIVQGNPSGSNRIVWWLLNRAEKDGLKFVWHSGIGDYPLLNVPFAEIDLFHPGDGPRSGVLVWKGKGSLKWVPEGAKVITHSWPATRMELADLLRSSEYLISFDAYTGLTFEAALCGCPSVVLDDGYWTLEKHRGEPLNALGVTDSLNKLDEAKAEVGLAFQAYLDYFPQMEQQLDRFISLTQEL
jgi:hypothetical protein